MDKLTHLDEQGRARMVDVAAKEATVRRAVASTTVTMAPDPFAALVDGRLAKGEALAVARIAGISAAKRTSELIPLCHQLPLSSVSIDFESDPESSTIRVICEARTVAQTGVEMEALVGASIAALTIYDMCKGLDRTIEIGPTRLEEKSGGKSGNYRRSDSR